MTYPALSAIHSAILTTLGMAQVPVASATASRSSTGMVSAEQSLERSAADLEDAIELEALHNLTTLPIFFAVERTFESQSFTLYMINKDPQKQVLALFKGANSWPRWFLDLVRGNRLALFTMNASVIDPHLAFIKDVMMFRLDIYIPAAELVSHRYVLDMLARGSTADNPESLNDLSLSQGSRIFVLGREPRRWIRAIYRGILSLVPFAAGLIARNVYHADAEIWLAVVGGGISFVAILIMF